ncbi:sulfite exporter TauE/SafE family protein [Sphingomonas mucosissima]|uniref:Probable membrane transporter protein n=1 Tax=Sphingomonas mucosissima TaxID=370959 RepID=A0A245ZRM7_9SPHN|nr:sulfite exporter TauE/SafE family protein [Sphingomonas mucosissima]OWK32386.1 hypothetical protein SPMU_07110 [Sphingomonas mucosissima]
MLDLVPFLLMGLSGFVGGAMNALAGGGSFATMPALLAIGQPANIANATSNFALLPGAGMSSWSFRDELAPVGGVSLRVLGGVTFVAGLVGSALLVVTPTRTFDVIVPWLVLYAFVVLAFGQRASVWLARRFSIGARTLICMQGLLGVYGGYFGGGIGLMMTATYGLLTGMHPRAAFAPRTLMLTIANGAAAVIFISFGMIAWAACIPMLIGGIAGGWAGAHVGKRLPAGVVRMWTLFVSGATALVFFWRAYG